jgi:hypothetical protein
MTFYANQPPATLAKHLSITLAMYCIALTHMAWAGGVEDLPRFTCGFVAIEPRSDIEADRIYPAAFLQTARDDFYLLTYRTPNPTSHKFYYKDAETEFTSSIDYLLSDETHLLPSPPMNLLIAYRITLSDLDSDLIQIILKCVVHESQFVNSRIGMQAAIAGQSFSKKTPGVISRGIVAATDHIHPDFLAEPYDLFLPPSDGAPAFSWVYSLDDNYVTPQPKVLGLLIDHVRYKQGDGFLSKSSLLNVISNSPSFYRLHHPNRDTRSVWLSNVAGAHNLSDTWLPRGFAAVNFVESAIIRAAEEPPPTSFLFSPEIGFPGCLLKCDSKTYLVFRDAKKFHLRLNSRMAIEDAISKKDYLLKHYFEPVDKRNFIHIGEGLSALAALPDKELPREITNKVIDLDRSYPDDANSKVQWGFSIPRIAFESSLMPLEESIVYCAVPNPDSSTAPNDLPNFDSGIYPALVYNDDGQEQTFAGVLGGDSKTGNPKLYSPADLRAAFLQTK